MTRNMTKRKYISVSSRCAEIVYGRERGEFTAVFRPFATSEKGKAVSQHRFYCTVTVCIRTVNFIAMNVLCYVQVVQPLTCVASDTIQEAQLSQRIRATLCILWTSQVNSTRHLINTCYASSQMYCRSAIHYTWSNEGMRLDLDHGTEQLDQGRTQDRADGAKAPPPKSPEKKIIYSFKSGAFYVSQFLHPLADYVPPDSID